MIEQILLNDSVLLPPNRLSEPDSWVGHIPFALWLVEQTAPGVLVELGTHTGNSYFSFCQAVLANRLVTRCYAVDTWQGDEQAGYYGEEIYQSVLQYNDRHYHGFSRLLRMTFDEALSHFSPGSIDLLHIDGLHTYEAVRHDFETWRPKLSARGVVLFHDTNVREGNFGVWRLWEELSAKYPHVHLSHSHGLGVLFVGGDQPEGVRALLGEWSYPAGQVRIRRLFERLGSGVRLELHNTGLRQTVTELTQTVENLAAAEKNLTRTVADLAVREEDLIRTVADLAAREEDLTRGVADLTQAVAEREERIAELDRGVAARDQHLACLTTERAAIFASTSWRVTRPLRWCGHQVKRFRHVWKILPRLLQRGDGFFRTLRKGVTVFRREGLAGVRQRIRAAQDDRACLPGGRGCDRNDYREWVRRYDTITDEARATILARIDKLVAKPFISVLMPTYNPKPEWLVAAIESVRGQLYPHWQLCIADDASTDPAVRAILERYAAEDARIRVVFRERNGHISAASNSALELATGEWLALLDHDDLLTEHALFWVAEAIAHAPHARLIYSDEDKIDEAGRRYAPYFKCDWNVDLFYSHNLVTHLGVYATDLVREIGGFREGLEGAQDYDLALRCLERLESRQIHHIPRVLYHWRMHAESTAQSTQAKPYAVLAGERALNEHFQRLGIAATSELLESGAYRAHYALPERLPLVSLIIPTRNGLHLVRQCLESILRKTTYPNYEILLVDNGSDDPATLRYFKELESEARVRIVRDDRPFNYSALNNAAVQLTLGELIGLINNDVEVISPEWLSEMVSHALRPGVGAVGARLWYPNDTSQHAGVIVGVNGVAGHAHKHLPQGKSGYFGRANLIQAFSAVTAACLVIRKKIYEEVGGLNEENLRVAFNDVDFCLRVREAGYRNLWTPYAELYHHESATRGFENTPERRARFAKEIDYIKERWGEGLLHDPNYSPNLTLAHEDFSLAWPPRVELLAALKAPAQAPLSRADKALAGIDRSGLGLEIGPSHNPIAPKKAGFAVRILDHAGREELIAKYRDHGVNLENIEEVDYVWQGEPLSELVGGERYDWIIASHVIEHTPDLVDFLQQCEKLLKPEGVLSLVIPDKRYCFDYFRWPSSTGDVLQAYVEKRRRHTPGAVFDHFSMASALNGAIAWGPNHTGEIALIHPLAEARSMMEAAAGTSDYVDVHQWRFTPASFRLILSELRALELITLTEFSAFDTTGCEFFLALSKSAEPPTADRLPLSLQAVKELQSGFLGTV